RRSMLVVLFTETGIMPIRYRRALLALRYARGFAEISDDVEDIPRAAFRESLRIAGLGHCSWAADLHWVLASLPVPVVLDSSHLLTVEGIDGLMEKVEREVAALIKTRFLKNRLEPDNDSNLKAITRCFRQYLRLVNSAHRIAFTRFLLSDHRLAVEGLRHGNRVWRYVERELRLCRFCHVAVEDEPHALLVCTGHPALTGLR
ncbi:hypothetical protein C8R46DRAFT_844016, partial [Mycena filopes]